ncbi:hypothetical protein ACIQ6V_08085 [Streptomyces sp. NPDC096198]|uniref:hypothetical protein n=1 Tax=Streptomyces sp. NPDC096198 TaxID=3366080 RepID=UPI0037F71636
MGSRAVQMCALAAAARTNSGAAAADDVRHDAARSPKNTGTVIDTSTLRARLGIPLPLAEAIATELS